MEYKETDTGDQDRLAGRITDACFYALVAFGIIAFSVIVAALLLY